MIDAPDIFDKSDETYIRSQIHHYHTVKKDRTCADEVRFYGTLAKKHGIRLSALVYHIVTWTKNKATKYKLAYEYDKKAAFAAVLGIKERQFYTLLRQAKEAGLLDFERGFRQLRIWVMDKQLYKMSEDDVYKYSKHLAAKHGMTESILFLKIVYHTQNPHEEGVPGIRVGPHWFTTRFPWMSLGSVRRALYRLRSLDLVDWYKDEFSYRQNSVYYAVGVDQKPRPVSEVTSRQFVEPDLPPTLDQSHRLQSSKGSSASGRRLRASYPFGAPRVERHGTKRSPRDSLPQTSFE